MLIDTHAHIYMLENPAEAIEEAFVAGVGRMIVPTAAEDEFETVLELCHKYDELYALLGVHPEDCEKFSDKTASKMLELAHDPKVVGIGEIGLDYHYSKENKTAQKNCFINQLEIAKKLNLPVVIHDRDAHLDTFEILRESKVQNVLLHCFSGSVEFMKQCCNMGYKIALGGVVTFKNAKTAKEVAEAIDLGDLMLETDCPYLAPHPYRGEENSPKYIGFIAKEIANLKNIPYDSVVSKTTETAKKFFNID